MPINEKGSSPLEINPVMGELFLLAFEFQVSLLTHHLDKLRFICVLLC